MEFAKYLPGRMMIVSMIVMFLIVPFIPSGNAGHEWEKSELGALKYDHKYPFVVLEKGVILYSSKEDGGNHFDIWRMDVDGTNHRQLTDNDIDEFQATSDENGERIVFSTTADIFVMDFDGSDQEILIESIFTLKDASISSDGDRVVFSSNMDNDTDKNWGDYGYFESIPLDIWSCEIDGDDQEQLTDHNWKECLPAFSPDGKKIVFVAEESSGDEDIHLMDHDGSDWERLITWQNVDETYPSFSSDGRYIIFSDGSQTDKYAVMYDTVTKDHEYIKAETIDEDGNEISENIKGRNFRFYPPTENLDEIKVIYLSTDGAFYPKLSIWTAEKTKIYYTVDIGPIKREKGSYDSESLEGVSVGFTLYDVYYNNLTDENGYADFVLPIGKLTSTTINATIGDEWMTWTAYNNPPKFSDDLVEIGPLRLRTEKSDYWGEPLEGVAVGFEYGGAVYENMTDEEGYAYFRIVRDGRRVDSLPSGTMLSATWNGETHEWEDGEDEPTFLRFMISLGPIKRKTDESGYYGESLKGASVSFVYRSLKYENLTDDEGYAHFGPFTEDELPVGTAINVTYGGEWIAWEQGDSIPNFARYTVRIGPVKRRTDDYYYSGEPLKGAEVSFVYNGKEYKNITDGEGYAYFTLDLKELSKGTEINAVKNGQTVSWGQGDPNIPMFEESSSSWSVDSIMDDYGYYCGLAFVGGIILLSVIANAVKSSKERKKKREQSRITQMATAQKTFDRGREAAKKGNDHFNRKDYSRALAEYRTAQQNLEQSLSAARREKDEKLVMSIEGMLSSVRDNTVSVEMALDNKKVQDGYEAAEKEFQTAMRLLKDEKIFEARRNLMQISRDLEGLVTVARSRNFIQAIKNLTAFQVRVRENINLADMKMSQGIENVSFGGRPEVGVGGAMAMDVSISGTTRYEGGYVVETLTMKNNQLFDVKSVELRASFDRNVLRISHTHPTLPSSDTSVSIGTIPKGVEKKVDIFFDPLVSTSTHLDISLIYVDSSGKYGTSSLGRTDIEIRSPDFTGDRNMNIAALRDLIITEARYQDSKVYGIDPKVPLKDVLTLAKEGINETNFTKVRDTQSNDMSSSWFYASSGGGWDRIIIRASVINSTRALEIFAACSKREHLTTILAEISQRVTVKLAERWRQLQPVTQVNVEIKDSIIQRSNLDFGGMAGGAPGSVSISDSVVTRSKVSGGKDEQTGAYRNLLIMVLQDGVIDEEEERMLAEQRGKLGISMEQHYRLLSSLNR